MYATTAKKWSKAKTWKPLQAIATKSQNCVCDRLVISSARITTASNFRCFCAILSKWLKTPQSCHSKNCFCNTLQILLTYQATWNCIVLLLANHLQIGGIHNSNLIQKDHQTTFAQGSGPNVAVVPLGGYLANCKLFGQNQVLHP